MMEVPSPASFGPGRAPPAAAAPFRGSQWRGLPCLAIALLAMVVAVQGGFLLLAGLAGRGIANLSPPDAVRDTATGPMMTAGAAMLVGGGLTCVGGLVVAARGFRGQRLWPRPRSALGVLAGGMLLTLGTFLGVRARVAPPRLTPPMAGLEGAWHDQTSSHVYRFNPDGTVDSWWSGLGGGSIGRWSRSGQTITVQTTLNWTFTGTLQGQALNGSIRRTSDGQKLGPMTWERRIVP